ncbi:MAG: hypothetical protein M1817_005084 [Caeruleum heppii]|nr:MAG: hypothetical protein M1817_005084 [Caeruleum heppii]
MSIDNANPTILNPSDLPTRRTLPSTATAKAQKPGSSIFPDSLAASNFLSDPFEPRPGRTEESDSDDGEGSVSGEDAGREEIDEQEIFDLISTISDPEHPLSLGSLAVVSLPDIFISPPPSTASLTPTPNALNTVTVLITPTITHCSLATVIGLGVRVRLEQSLPPRFRVDVRIKEGSHSTAEQVTKQLNDKERVAAALENGTLRGVLGKMMETCV